MVYPYIVGNRGSREYLVCDEAIRRSGSAQMNEHSQRALRLWIWAVIPI